MLIDWFTYFAQIFNFLILVWLLRRFLYRPILDAMEQREQKIAKSLSDAEQTKHEAQKEKAEFAKKNEEFAEKVETMKKEAEIDASRMRQKWLNDARAEIDRQKRHWLHALDNEKASELESLLKKVEKEIFDIARKVLEELGNESISTSIANKFCDRLKKITDKEREAFSTLTLEGKHPMTIKSAFELPPASIKLLKEAIAQVFKQGQEILFEVDPKLIGGIEIWLNEEKISWSISEYLSVLQKALKAPLEEKS